MSIRDKIREALTIGTLATLEDRLVKIYRELYVTEIPWKNTESWITGDWYPLPFGYFERDQDEYIIEGYGIYMLDPKAKHRGDITRPVEAPDMAFTFSSALSICEHWNRRLMKFTETGR